MIVIFVEFIDQLIDYPINRASPSSKAAVPLSGILFVALWLLLLFCPLRCLIVVFTGNCLLSFRHLLERRFFAWCFILHENILF